MDTPLLLPPDGSAGSLWDALRDQCWRRRPAIFKRPFGSAFSSAESVLRGLRELGASASTPRIYADRKLIQAAPEHSWQREDTTAERFCERLMRSLNCRELAYFVNDFQQFDPELWRASVQFLQGLHGAVGFPAGPAFLGLFMGKYERTPFGFHKDIQDVFTFVLEGHKRFLTWPYAAMEGHPLRVQGALHNELALWDFDYSAVRDSACVVEGEPGDVLYWPWDWWHVAESDGSFSMTGSLGVTPFGDPAAEWRAAAKRVGHVDFTADACRAGDQQGAQLEARLAALSELVQDPRVQQALREDLLRRRSAFGFSAAPARCEMPSLEALDWVQAPLPGLIVWEVNGEQLMVAATGQLFRTHHSGALVALLEELNEGRAVQFGPLVRSRGWTASEGLLRDVVRVLISFGALQRLDRSGRSDRSWAKQAHAKEEMEDCHG